MSQRKEFVMLATQEGSNISQLCKRFGISRDKGYKWLRRFLAEGEQGLKDRPRRPNHAPGKTDLAVERAIIDLRNEHPAWGARKIKHRLEALHYTEIPATSTITDILRRNDLISPLESKKRQAFIRFEHPHPNALWQMDFKGHFPIQNGRCHPLTVLDDHSRYNVLLQACADETAITVKNALITAFRQYGLPDRMTMDNGSPWGCDDRRSLSIITAWLVRLGIVVSHSRPYHPQTQGKDERFHRTLLVEAITGQQFTDIRQCQRHFDKFRTMYNLERPHEAIGMQPPVGRYQPSVRAYPEVLAAIEYGPDDLVRKVQDKGQVSLKGRTFKVSNSLRGEPIAFRPSASDGTYSVYYCHHKLGDVRIDDGMTT
jgi:transposase InsO family protein